MECVNCAQCFFIENRRKRQLFGFSEQFESLAGGKQERRDGNDQTGCGDYVEPGIGVKIWELRK